MKRFGLIGYPLGHSFSRTYFQEKFITLGLDDHDYSLFEIASIEDFSQLWERYPDLVGVNVTVPYKEKVIEYLDDLDMSASSVGAVNVIKRQGARLIGFNSDVYGFKHSLIRSLPHDKKIKKALILGGGGASKAVVAAFKEMGVSYQLVSRQLAKGNLTYDDLKTDASLIRQVDLVVNTTPLGMHPSLDTKPDLPYDSIHSEQYLYDLVYNPEETAFMKEGSIRGARTKNGLEMLYSQADRAWEIWNS